MSNRASQNVPAPASVVVNNHNYAHYLGRAIESALSQSYANTEVIVVDDGSQDESRAVIDRYRGRVRCVLKEQGGQGSALNAGFAHARGQGLCFLDADDVLDPDALARAMPLLSSGEVSNVRWPLREVDADGTPTGVIRPTDPLEEGDLAPLVVDGGPDTYVISPTSGNLWSRGFLECVLPMPEDDFRLCADAYLFGLAPLYGELRSMPEALGDYRVHGANAYSSLGFEEKLERDLHNWELRSGLLAERCRTLGFDVDIASWRASSWFHRLKGAVGEMCSLVPAGSSIVLIDEDQWGVQGSLRGRTVTPLPARHGRWWGLPADGDQALAALQEARARYAAVAWPAFWWLEHYPELGGHLRGHRCLADNDRIKVFDLEE